MGDILKEISISRNASKEKYSIKVPKIKIAEPEDLSPEQLSIINNGLKNGVLYLFLDHDNSASTISAPLTTKQQDIIKLLNNTNKSLKEYDGLNHKACKLLKDDKRYCELREEYLELMKEAVRAGLLWHHLVHEFIYTYKALGDKEILRKIKRGWETDVQRPLTITDFSFINHLEKIAEYRIEGKSWPQIRQILMKHRIIKKITWQALRMKFKKAWEEAFKEVNKKPPPIP